MEMETREDYVAARSKGLDDIVTWMNLKNIMLRKKGREQRDFSNMVSLNIHTHTQLPLLGYQSSPCSQNPHAVFDSSKT